MFIWAPRAKASPGLVMPRLVLARSEAICSHWDSMVFALPIKSKLSWAICGCASLSKLCSCAGSCGLAQLWKTPLPPVSGGAPLCSNCYAGHMWAAGQPTTAHGESPSKNPPLFWGSTSTCLSSNYTSAVANAYVTSLCDRVCRCRGTQQQDNGAPSGLSPIPPACVLRLPKHFTMLKWQS